MFNEVEDNMSKKKQPAMLPLELLAPVGREEHLTVALEEGADAIYLGASDLNARGDRAQFDEGDLPRICERAHAKGVKVYLTLNILLANHELPQALRLAGLAYNAGVNAVIVQDRGLAKVLHDYLPDLPLHASTQFSVTSLEALDQLPKLGFTRVVAPRELLLPELKAYIKRASELNLEVEVFVQGAMCISVSGQCLMSWSEGTRSANRGNCAQPCRLSYKLLQDGKAIGQERRLISPSDMSRLEDLQDLVDAGVTSFKIEGRLRSENYVRTAVHVYRDLLDRMIVPGEEKTGTTESLTREKALIHTAFSRGPSFNRGYDGGRGKRFLSGERSAHHGLYVGEVGRIFSYKGELIVYSPDEPLLELKPGAVWSLRDENEEELASAPIHQYEVRDRGVSHTVLLRGFHPAILRELEGKKVSAYLMSYPLDKKEETAVETSNRQLNLRLSSGEGMNINLVGTLYRSDSDRNPATVTVTKQTPKDYSSRLDEDRIRKQLGKLGGTPYEAGDIEIETEVVAPVSWLNSLRRELIEILDTVSADDATIRTAVERAHEGIQPDRMAEVFESHLKKLITKRYMTAKDSILKGRGKKERLLDYVSWQGAPITREVIDRLSGSDTPDLIMLPLDKLVRHGVPELPDGISIFAEVPVSLPFELWDEVKAGLPHLDWSNVTGIVSYGDLSHFIAELQQVIGAEHTLRLIAGPGSQVTNEISLRELADHGYTDIYLDDLVNRGDEDAWVKGLEERYPEINFWVPGAGRSRNMTMRFCPVGYSDPNCKLCLSHRYSLQNADGKVFDLANEKGRDCSAMILSSEGSSAGDNLSPSLEDSSLWMGEQDLLPVGMIQSSANPSEKKGSDDESTKPD